MKNSTESIKLIEERIGYTFENKLLLVQAFTRKSYSAEHTGIPNNEVLEFYGDAVLSLSVADLLLDCCATQNEKRFGFSAKEGELSAWRSKLTNKKYLANRMRALNLQDFLLASIGDRQQGVLNEDSVQEDLFESIVGAIYLDCGRDLSVVNGIVENLLDIKDGHSKENVSSSPKNDVQEWCQKRGYDIPQYNTSFSLDANSFESCCSIAELDICVRGTGKNKKEAENNAAAAVYKLLREVEESHPEGDLRLDGKLAPFWAVNKLQEYCQAEGLPFPAYSVQEETASGDKHVFTVCCCFQGRSTLGKGTNKKAAKKQAAYLMLVQLGLTDGSEDPFDPYEPWF